MNDSHFQLWTWEDEVGHRLELVGLLVLEVGWIGLKDPRLSLPLGLTDWIGWPDHLQEAIEDMLGILSERKIIYDNNRR